MNLALNFEHELQKDRPLHADMLELLRGGEVQILHDSETALLLKDKSWDLYMISALNIDEGKGLIDSLPEGNKEIVIRNNQLASYAIEKFGFNSSYEFMNVLYEKDTPPKIGGILEIRHPDAGEFDKVADTYHMVDKEQLLIDFNSPDFFAGYAHGEFVGYIGLHPEGSMGLLHVFESFRHSGYGRELTAFMIGRQLSLGRLPYCQVFTNNAASIKMLEGLGMTFAKDNVFWLWNP